MDRNGQVAADLLGTNVALRKESVDRNFTDFQLLSPPLRRSPQGERG